MVRRRRKNGRLSVFSGREAKLNLAIFHILALKGPLTIYGAYKKVKTQRGLGRTRYATVNKRIRSLEESGFVRKVSVRETKAGFEASIYELNAKAYLAILFNFTDMDGLLMHVDEATAQTILAVLLHTIKL